MTLVTCTVQRGMSTAYALHNLIHYILHARYKQIPMQHARRQYGTRWNMSGTSMVHVLYMSGTKMIHVLYGTNLPNSGHHVLPRTSELKRGDTDARHTPPCCWPLLQGPGRGGGGWREMRQDQCCSYLCKREEGGWAVRGLMGGL